ncbi:MAG: PH domain-containing protein [Actinomycetota bacterium]|nr:PH domain-containing protein [Acidimicrobiia bacterium]MDQ3294222.1 PH domain-containing protein [Actinomycetota bacterium]
MAFPPKLLNDGEEIVHDLRPHWWYMAETSAAVLGSAILGVVVAVVFKDDDGTLYDVLRIASIVLIVLSLVWFGVRYAKWATTNFVVTSDRLIYRAGVLAKTGIEIPLERVNTVFFNQTIFERMLGAGDLSIESGGETGKQTFSDIRRPSLVQNEIYRQMEANNARMYSGRTRTGAAPDDAAPMAPVGGGSITEQIEQLDGLRQRGLISEAEFSEKKAELLKRM